jgi:subtilisin inhibitor-like
MVVALLALAFGGSPSAALTITVWPHGQAHASRVWTLRCSPAEGTLPRRGAACYRLSALPSDPFAPTPRGTVCTQIYGGPQVARVRGRFRGRRVSTTFTRRDGCAIRRWNRVSFLFPARL